VAGQILTQLRLPRGSSATAAAGLIVDGKRRVEYSERGENMEKQNDLKIPLFQ
jgi:hypothetical protein